MYDPVPNVCLPLCRKTTGINDTKTTNLLKNKLNFLSFKDTKFSGYFMQNVPVKNK